MARRFDGLVTWITGGGTGIGRALALELASRGALVAVSGRREDCLHGVVREIEAKGGKALAAPTDVTEEEGLKRAVQSVVSTWGKLDICVANAGFGVAAPFEEVTAEQWRRQMDINVVGTCLTLQAALPEIRKTRGRLVVVSSVMGKLAVAGSSAYVASKYALVGLCDSLYQELHGSGVTLTNVMPGLVESEIGKVNNNGVLVPEAKDLRPEQLMWKADRAAQVMADAIHKRPRQFVFTAHGRLAVYVGQHWSALAYPLMARLGVKTR